MNKEIKFFISKQGSTFIGIDACDNAEIKDCAGNILKPVKVGSVDAAKEKHVPVIEVNGNTVKVTVGSVNHPMAAEHHIAWICLKTEKGIQFKELPVDGKPEVEFSITADDKVVEAFEFCNLHGIWVGK